MALSETNGAKGVFFLVNLDCSGCGGVIAKSLKKIDGIRDVGINYVTDKVYVNFDPAKVTSDQIRTAIERAGCKVFEVTRTRGD
jgi:Cu+-exporting ATPase